MSRNRVDIVREVLARSPAPLEALVNAKRADGATPLALASRSGYPETVRLLLRCGASADVRCGASQDGKEGDYPFSVSKTPSLRRVYEAEMFVQTARGDTERVTAFLLGGVPPSATDGTAQSNTLLHWAACFGNAPLIRRILDIDVSLANARNAEGCTGLHEAALAGHVGALGVLVELGADPAICGTAGYAAGKTASAVACVSMCTEEAFEAVPALAAGTAERAAALASPEVLAALRALGAASARARASALTAEIEAAHERAIAAAMARLSLRE